MITALANGKAFGPQRHAAGSAPLVRHARPGSLIIAIIGEAFTPWERECILHWSSEPAGRLTAQGLVSAMRRLLGLELSVPPADSRMDALRRLTLCLANHDLEWAGDDISAALSAGYTLHQVGILADAFGH